MTEPVTPRMAELAAQESRLVFDAFDHDIAWRLGTLMVERALRDKAPIIIDIRRPGLILFRSALAGTTAENEVWLERKAQTVFRFETSTALLEARFAAQDIDQWEAGWFDTERFAAAGGSFPIRVHGVGVVAAVTGRERAPRRRSSACNHIVGGISGGGLGSGAGAARTTDVQPCRRPPVGGVHRRGAQAHRSGVRIG